MNFLQDILLPTAISTVNAAIQYSIKNETSARARKLYIYLKPLQDSINQVLSRIKAANPDLP